MAVAHTPDILHIISHTPPECMAKWLTSQNRNLVLLNILFDAVISRCSRDCTSECMRSTRDQRRKKSMNEQQAPVFDWIFFYFVNSRQSSQYTHVVFLFAIHRASELAIYERRIRNTQNLTSFVLSETFIFIENEHDILSRKMMSWWCRDTEHYEYRCCEYHQRYCTDTENVCDRSMR